LEDYIQKGIQREEGYLVGYKYIYNGLNEISFYQVGVNLQDESCYAGWIPHISVGSEKYNLGLVSESWISLI
jgi:hypothetical protein